MKSFPQELVGSWRVISYVVRVDSEIYIIDAGVRRESDWSRLDKLVNELGGWGRVEAVVLTHAHADHTGMLSYIEEACNAPVYVHVGDKWMIEDYGRYIDSVLGVMEEAVKWGFPKKYLFYVSLKWSRRGRVTSKALYWEGGEESLGKLKLIHTPGHSPGSSSVLVGKYMFTGDTVGRATPLIDDFEEQINSLKLIGSLDVERLYTAHDGELYRDQCFRLIDSYAKKLRRVIEACKSECSFTEMFTRVYGGPARLGFRCLFAVINLIKYIRYLEDKGVIEKTGSGVKTMWKLASRAREALASVREFLNNTSVLSNNILIDSSSSN